MKNKIERYKQILLSGQLQFFENLWVYIKQHLIELELFVVAVFVLRLYIQIPYINLLISPFLYHLILVFIAISLFSIKHSTIMIGILVALVVSIIPALGLNSSLVDSIASIVYFMLWYVFIRMVLELRK